MRAAVVAASLLAAACAARAEPPAHERLAELQRDVTVVAFWATWCGPCREELPKLEALHQRYKDDPKVRVVAVSVDRAGKAAAAKKLAAQSGLTLPQLVDGSALYFKLLGGNDTDVPRLAVVDRTLRGVESLGSDADATTDDFVREVAAAVDAVRAGQPARAPKPWRAFTPARP
jgi:thiol-disulfide isomerase/thioredoxin